MRIITEHKPLHLNPLKLSHYPSIGPDFMHDAVKEALEQRDAALEEIERLKLKLKAKAKHRSTT
jgi:hypothetical protein